METFRDYEPTLKDLIEDAPLRLILEREKIHPREFETHMRQAGNKILRRSKRT